MLTPIGKLYISEEGAGVTKVSLASSALTEPTPLLLDAKRQLEEYFRGERKVFELLLDVKGSAFQKDILKAMHEIPYGSTISYKELALQAGHPKAIRAAGGACHNNPIMIILPCHRVVGANGKLTGFACGLEAKEFLLDLEKNNF